jgi:hypothetical protein
VKSLSEWNCPELLVYEGEAMGLVNAIRQVQEIGLSSVTFLSDTQTLLTVSKVELKVHRSLTLLFLVLEVF